MKNTTKAAFVRLCAARIASRATHAAVNTAYGAYLSAHTADAAAYHTAAYAARAAARAVYLSAAAAHTVAYRASRTSYNAYCAITTPTYRATFIPRAARKAAYAARKVNSLLN